MREHLSTHCVVTLIVSCSIHHPWLVHFYSSEQSIELTNRSQWLTIRRSLRCRGLFWLFGCHRDAVFRRTNSIRSLKQQQQDEGKQRRSLFSAEKSHFFARMIFLMGILFLHTSFSLPLSCHWRSFRRILFEWKKDKHRWLAWDILLTITEQRTDSTRTCNGRIHPTRDDGDDEEEEESKKEASASVINLTNGVH